MAHSTTTATSTYVLTRYSKSHSKNGPNNDSQFEWQHFTNPTIHLVLDQRKGTELESVRLRILWSMEMNNSNNNDIEDIDLLAFSRLPQRTHNHQSAEGLPLKAVYRENLVGIRYLQLPNNSDAPVYRRFQITFQNTTAASEFVDLIRPVCPCKANSGPAPSRPMLSSTLRNAASTMTSTSVRPFQDEQRPRNEPTQTPNAGVDTSAPLALMPPIQISSWQKQPCNPMFASSPPGSSASTMSTATPHVSMPPPGYVTRPSMRACDPVQSQNSSTLDNTNLQQGHMRPPIQTHAPHTNPEQRISMAGPEFHPTPAFGRTEQHLEYPSQEPYSQQYFTSRNQAAETLSAHTQIPFDNPPNNRPPTDALNPAAPFLASLRTMSGLYELPQPALERLVAEVIREPGFTQLMEKLDSMWALRSCMGK